MHYKFIAFTCYQRLSTIPPFADLIRKLQINHYRTNMLSIASKIPRKMKKGGTLQPVLPLIPDKLETTDDQKSKFVSLELKTRVGQPDNATKYKKFVQKFEEGTPQQWIDLLRDLNEIWTQNSINGGTDRASTVRALVRGESSTAFESALQDARTDENGVEQQMTAEHVETALNAVSTTVFPHRALEIQKLWMNRRMFKPAELTTRQTAAAINRLNNSLPLFPGGSDASKFTDVEIVGLLEWSLPPAWRAKFDLDGYIPSLDSKARLIDACEAIERNEVAEEKEAKPTKKGKGGKPKNENSESAHKKGDNKKKKFFCTEHGHNATHGTSDCYTLKNRANKNGTATAPHPVRSFSNKAFRKEVNFLARASDKKKVLDLYATAVQREQAKLAKRVGKRKKSNDATSDNESDDDMSVQLIEAPVKVRNHVASSQLNKLVSKKQACCKNDSTSLTTEEKTLEENAYQRKLLWLQDHGEPDLFEPRTPPPPADSSDDES